MVAAADVAAKRNPATEQHRDEQGVAFIEAAPFLRHTPLIL
jgi:hypothetical protein